ncbi:MAG: glycyl-radical enzyme activating protein [FCB group bacterium]|nr:glycyl-radical enzyme activating protein [FCB group bacterium]
MTGTIFDIKKFAIHDGPGIRTTVFLKGCPLNCWWCHNPESMRVEPDKVQAKTSLGDDQAAVDGNTKLFGRLATVDEVMTEIIKDSIFYDQSGGGVTFSGGEPMLQIDFLVEMLTHCRDYGIHTAVDTAGLVPWEYFEKTEELVDLYLFDLKLMNQAAHEKYVGVSNGLILENLTRLTRTGRTIWMRIPLIPEITDTDENLDAISEFLTVLGGIEQINLLPYNPLGERKFEKLKIRNKLGHLFTQTDVKLRDISRRFAGCGSPVKVGG